MGDIHIRFRFDTTTGRKEIVIEYEPDDDLLPVEHERKHRRLVEQLVGQGVLKPDEASGVRVERVRPNPVAGPQPAQPAPQPAPPVPKGPEPVKT